MAVWCRQSVDGVPGEPFRIAPHRPDQTDAELLAAKAAGAADKGWAVWWLGTRRFKATKVRWQGNVCVRDFWTG